MSPLLGSARGFVEQAAPSAYVCSECLERFDAGSPCLVSIRGGKVKKRVCSDECRLQFDGRIWQEIADERMHK